MRCWEAEERIAILIILFRRIAEVEESIAIADRPADFADTILELYGQWQAAAQQWEQPIADLEKSGYEVTAAHEFKDAIRESRGILTPDDQFFDHPRLWHARDKAIKASRRRKRPSPRHRSKTTSPASKR